MLMTIILPTIVIFACEMIPYKTISALNHAVMWKVFVFLLMMVIILPSAGFLRFFLLYSTIDFCFFIYKLIQIENIFQYKCLFGKLLRNQYDKSFPLAMSVSCRQRRFLCLLCATGGLFGQCSRNSAFARTISIPLL